jgi:hypothetical protein
MCKEMPGIPAIRVVETKRMIGKMEGRGGREALGVADKKTMVPAFRGHPDVELRIV